MYIYNFSDDLFRKQLYCGWIHWPSGMNKPQYHKLGNPVCSAHIVNASSWTFLPLLDGHYRCHSRTGSTQHNVDSFAGFLFSQGCIARGFVWLAVALFQSCGQCHWSSPFYRNSSGHSHRAQIYTVASMLVYQPHCPDPLPSQWWSWIA